MTWLSKGSCPAISTLDIRITETTGEHCLQHSPRFVNPGRYLPGAEPGGRSRPVGERTWKTFLPERRSSVWSRALVNLLDNAMKFNGPGGHVRIEGICMPDELVESALGKGTAFNITLPSCHAI
jgi:hypothetical protein